MSDDDQPGVERLQDALTRAYEARSQYDIAVQIDASGGEAATRKHRIRFQQLVLHTLSLLRPYLVSELRDRYWEDAAIYQDKEEGIEIRGLKKLVHYQGLTTESGQWEETERGEEYIVREEPVLLPPDAVRHTLDLLAEATYILGFLEKPSKRREKFNVSVFEDDERAAEVLE
jgi:hypothetical protein